MFYSEGFKLRLNGDLEWPCSAGETAMFHPVLVGKCGGKRSKHPVFVIVLAVGINTGTGKGLSIFELLQATSIITHYA